MAARLPSLSLAAVPARRARALDLPTVIEAPTVAEFPAADG